MSGRVLLLCEEEAYQEYYKKLSEEFQLIRVENEREILQILTGKDDVVDVIMLDLRMNRKKSIALIELLTMDIYTKYVGTLVIGTRQDSDAEYKALKAGAHDFVYKPIHFDALKLRLNHLIDVHREMLTYRMDEEKDEKAKIYEQTLVENVDKALKDGQFKILMQPKYDLVTGNIAGAETLIRWIHPQKGLIPPTEFIPALEKSGFITKLDMFVWEETCKIIKSWIDKGNCYVPVSVNVSRKDIYFKGLPAVLMDLVHKYGLEPKHLHLEITETAYMDNPKQLITVVTQLKELGFVIEMDDFGSGYSSLNMLSVLPIDILKLDMKLVQNASVEYQGRSIVNFVISLAKWMNLYVVAEGVETAEQVNSLKNMDCNYVQGYFYAKPLEITEITEIILGQTISPMPGSEDGFSEKSIAVKSHGHEKTMLVVDDLAMNRMILTEYFKDYFNVIELSNAKVALEYIMAHPKIDLIMLDLYMPYMDGFEFLEEVRKHPDISSIPIIVTSQADKRGKKMVLELGARDYLEKPYSLDMAFRSVNNVLDEKIVIGHGFAKEVKEK